MIERWEEKYADVMEHEIVTSQQIQRWQDEELELLRAEVERLKERNANVEAACSALVGEVERMKQEQANEIVSIEGMPVGMGNEPEQAEPVAWLHRKTNQAFISEPPPSLKAQCDQLYTAPQGQTALLKQALEALERVFSVWMNEIDCEQYPLAEEQMREAISVIKQHLGEA